MFVSYNKNWESQNDLSSCLYSISLVRILFYKQRRNNPKLKHCIERLYECCISQKKSKMKIRNSPYSPDANEISWIELCHWNTSFEWLSEIIISLNFHEFRWYFCIYCIYFIKFSISNSFFFQLFYLKFHYILLTSIIFPRLRQIFRAFPTIIPAFPSFLCVSNFFFINARIGRYAWLHVYIAM